MVFAIECVAASASRSALMKTETLSQKFSDLTSATTKFTGNGDDIIGGSFFAIRGSGSEPVRYGCLAHLNAPDAGHGVRDGTDGRYTQI